MRRRNLAASIVILGTPIVASVWMLLARVAPPGAAADFAEASDGLAPWYLTMLDDMSWVAWAVPLAMLVSAGLVLRSSAGMPHPSVLRLGLVLAFELLMLLLTWRWLGKHIENEDAPAAATSSRLEADPSREPHVSFIDRQG